MSAITYICHVCLSGDGQIIGSGVLSSESENRHLRVCSTGSRAVSSHGSWSDFDHESSLAPSSCWRHCVKLLFVIRDCNLKEADLRIHASYQFPLCLIFPDVDGWTHFNLIYLRSALVNLMISRLRKNMPSLMFKHLVTRYGRVFSAGAMHTMHLASLGSEPCLTSSQL